MMKTILKIITITVLGTSSFLSAKSLEQLKIDWKKAYETKNYELIWDSVYYEPKTQKEWKDLEYEEGKKHFELYTNYSEEKWGKTILGAVEAKEHKYVPPKNPSIYNGYKYTPTIEPIGFLSMSFALENTKNVTTIQASYAKIGENYYIVGRKRTSVNWQGPKDKHLRYRTIVKIADNQKARLEVEYNVSGVTLKTERILTSKGGGTTYSILRGQYITKLTILGESTYDSIEVQILDDNDKSIFTKVYSDDTKVLYDRESLINKSK